jgi:signal transduction histidine kinase
MPPREPVSTHETLRPRRVATLNRLAALSDSGAASAAGAHSSTPPDSKRRSRVAPPAPHHYLKRLVRKFHEFIVEFGADWKILSVWTSNFALSHEARHALFGKHLRDLLGAEAFHSLRHIFRGALPSPGAAPVVLNFTATVDGKLRWFDANLSCAAAARGVPSRSVLRVLDVSLRHLIEVRLRNSEILLEHAEEVAEMGTWDFDLAAGASTWSKQLFRLHNLEPLNRPLRNEEVWRIINFKNARKLRRDFRLTIRKGVPFRYTEPQPQPDGSVRILVGLGAPVFDSSGKVVRIVGVTRDITSQIRTQSDLRSLSHQMLTIRSEEQRRMGRDLHETTSQTLAALKMTLAQIGRSVQPNNHKVLQLVRSSADLASAAVREVRLVSSLLYPPLLKEAGLVAALDSYTKLFADRSGISVTLRIADSFGRLEKELELTVFRIIQETLTNVHRHAHASAAIVRVERRGAALLVDVQDDGVGISDSATQPSAKIPLGVGIAGMRERVHQLHGQFEVITAPGEGTAIRALLPLASSEEPPNEHKSNAERSRRAKDISRPRRGRPLHRSQGSSLAARN